MSTHPLQRTRPFSLWSLDTITVGLAALIVVGMAEDRLTHVPGNIEGTYFLDLAMLST